MLTPLKKAVLNVQLNLYWELLKCRIYEIAGNFLLLRLVAKEAAIRGVL